MGEGTEIFVSYGSAPRAYRAELSDESDRKRFPGLNEESVPREVAAAYLEYLGYKKSDRAYDAYIEWAVNQYCGINFPKKEAECAEKSGSSEFKLENVAWFEWFGNEKYGLPLNEKGEWLFPPPARIIKRWKPAPVAAAARAVLPVIPAGLPVEVPASEPVPVKVKETRKKDEKCIARIAFAGRTRDLSGVYVPELSTCYYKRPAFCSKKKYDWRTDNYPGCTKKVSPETVIDKIKKMLDITKGGE